MIGPQDIPPIPDECPDRLLEGLVKARVAALLKLSELTEAEAVRAEARRKAEAAALRYRNLLLEARGQGVLDLGIPSEEGAEPEEGRTETLGPAPEPLWRTNPLRDAQGRPILCDHRDCHRFAVRIVSYEAPNHREFGGQTHDCCSVHSRPPRPKKN